MTEKRKIARFVGTLVGVLIGWQIHVFATNIFLNLTTSLDRQSFFWATLVVALPWIWVAFTFAAAIEKLVTGALIKVDEFVSEK